MLDYLYVRLMALQLASVPAIFVSRIIQESQGSQKMKVHLMDF